MSTIVLNEFRVFKGCILLVGLLFLRCLSCGGGGGGGADVDSLSTYMLFSPILNIFRQQLFALSIAIDAIYTKCTQQ